MPKMISALCALLSCVTLQACGPGEADAPISTGSGRLVIVGGALQADNESVYEAVIDGREGDGPLCVVPTASNEPREAIDRAVERLTRLGGPGSAKGVLISTEDPSRAREPNVVAELTTCSGFFFTGGSQSRILDVFLPAGDTTEAYHVLWQRWQEGAVVAGTSAGAAMMSRMMISGGGSNEAVAHGVAAGSGDDGVRIRQGMGFFEPILDQHFLARGRFGRLLVSVIQADLPHIGLGIDENTALVVDGDSAVVVGASGVVVVDGRLAQRTAPNRASGVRVILAGTGDVVDLETLEVGRAGVKRSIPVTEPSLALPDDPFARWALLHLFADLSASVAREAVFNLPGATLRIAEDTGFSASMRGSAGGVESTPSGFSAGPFRVDLLGPGS
jgi:cyanophycinase